MVTAGIKNNTNLLSSYGVALENENSMNGDDENYPVDQETEMEDNDGS